MIKDITLAKRRPPVIFSDVWLSKNPLARQILPQLLFRPKHD